MESPADGVMVQLIKPAVFLSANGQLINIKDSLENRLSLFENMLHICFLSLQGPVFLLHFSPAGGNAFDYNVGVIVRFSIS